MNLHAKVELVSFTSQAPKLPQAKSERSSYNCPAIKVISKTAIPVTLQYKMNIFYYAMKYYSFLISRKKKQKKRKKKNQQKPKTNKQTKKKPKTKQTNKKKQFQTYMTLSSRILI